jgi:hypothetical protein
MWLMAAALGLLAAGCEPLPQGPPPGTPVPTSPWAEGFAFKYATPPSAGTQFPVTIAVVNPFYKEEESAFLAPLYTKVGKGLSASMGSDFEKLLVAKGMTATGPFPALDEITYSEKKGAALVFAPRVFITTKVEYGQAVSMVRDGQTRLPDGRVLAVRAEKPFAMTVTGWISFIMQEPLSGEKMWIKKLDLDPVVVKGVEAYDTVEETRTDTDFFGGTTTVPTGNYQQGKEVLYDGKPDALASALSQIYPVIMDKFWRLVEPEEMVVLKDKGEEIRKLKVY